MSNKTNNTNYVGDCSFSGIVKKAVDVYKIQR